MDLYPLPNFNGTGRYNYQIPVLGVTHGDAGLFEFTRLKHINWDLLPLKSDWWWFPYTPAWEQRFKLLMKVLYRLGLRKIA